MSIEPISSSSGASSDPYNPQNYYTPQSMGLSESTFSQTDQEGNQQAQAEMLNAIGDPDAMPYSMS